MAEAIHAVLVKCNMNTSMFSFVQGASKVVGQALVQHPMICAVGFTGSLAGGPCFV